MNNEIQNIISGKSKVSHGEFIQTILDYLIRSQNAGKMDKNNKYFKEKETESLILFIGKNLLWYNDIDTNLYLSEGAEQKVYIKDEKNVYKLNDANVFYIQTPKLKVN